VEGGLPAAGPAVERLLKASQNLVDQIGPWDQPRLPPPVPGNVRFTFLVSDGLYLGDGPRSAMQSDALGAPVLQAATELLQVVVDASTK
jgi:hypothetical protein